MWPAAELAFKPDEYFCRVKERFHHELVIRMFGNSAGQAIVSMDAGPTGFATGPAARRAQR